MANDHHHHHAVRPVGVSLYLILKSYLPHLPRIFDRSKPNDVEEDTLCIAVVVGDRLDGGNLINTSLVIRSIS